MIDSAINTGVVRKKYQEMQAEGIKIEETQAILLTHSHADHSRGIPYWCEVAKRSLPIYVGEKGVDVIRHKDAFYNSVVSELGDFQSQVTQIPMSLGNKVTDMIWGAPVDNENVHAIEPNQVWDCGDVLIKAYHTPGHNPDHHVYMVTITGDPKKYLISGDLISFKDMKDGQGEVALASFNNPMSSLRDEMKSLKVMLKEAPDVLMTAHYGIWEGKDHVATQFENAIGEAFNLLNRTHEILTALGPISFKKLTKEVINFPKYLSGINTRTCSMYVIIKEMEEEDMLIRTGKQREIIALKVPGSKSETLIAQSTPSDSP
jgi:glyoxylase-like metal-dependent hydrolase (beta-lactamase superfamily II)